MPQAQGVYLYILQQHPGPPEVKGLTDKVWGEAGLEDPDLSIGVSMDYDSWKAGSRYNALRISKKIIEIIRALHAADLIDLNKGSHNRSDPKWNRTTRIRASETLRQWFVEARFGRDDIGRTPNEEIIILKDKDDSENARQIEYEDTPDTDRMREELRAYNDLIASSFIDIRTLEEPVLRIRDDNGITRSIRLDEDAHRTRRIFSRGSWYLNGRFYGGWWQRINSDLRRQIMIDNEPTIEVDFQGLHVAMLYAKSGKAMSDDPYRISLSNYSKFPPERLRALTKKLVLKAINAKDKASAYRAFRGDIPEGDPAKHLKNTDLDQIIDAFLKRNPLLENHLFSDRGIDLMRLDSETTERVHNHFTQKGIPVLSVHDSYIIAVDHVDELRQAMADASKAVVGRPLRCGVDVPGYGEFDDVPESEMKAYIGRLTWDVYRSEVAACRGYVERMLAYEKRTGRSISGIDENG
jgi:hypothetical protein